MKCRYPGIDETGFAKSVMCRTLGSEVNDYRSYHLLILLLCKYRNCRLFIPANTVAGGNDSSELLDKSIFLRFSKACKKLRSFI